MPTKVTLGEKATRPVGASHDTEPGGSRKENAAYPNRHRRAMSAGSHDRPRSDRRSGDLGHLTSLHFGSAFWSSATPASVTAVPDRESKESRFNGISSFSPRSVTTVPPK